MFVVTVSFFIRPGAMDLFLPLMLENARMSLEVEPGCLQFDVCTDPLDASRIFLFEKYARPEAFDLHLQSEHFLAFDAQVASLIVSRNVEKLHEIPTASASFHSRNSGGAA